MYSRVGKCFRAYFATEVVIVAATMSSKTRLPFIVIVFCGNENAVIGEERREEVYNPL